MDDKLFDLMTKMYVDMKEMRADISVLKTDVSELKSDVSELKSDVSVLKTDMIGVKSDIAKLYNKLESSIEPKIEALFDGYKQTYELEKENSRKLDDIAEKVKKQEVEIKVIQGGKK